MGSFLVTPGALTNCHVVISKQCVGVGRSSRCVTGRRPRDENHAVRFRLSPVRIESRSEALVSSLMIKFERGCKHWHPPTPERRYGTRSPLPEYMSLHLSLKLTTNCVPLSRIKWERYIFIKKCVSFPSLKLVHYRWLCSWLGLWQVYNTRLFGLWWYMGKLWWYLGKQLV